MPAPFLKLIQTGATAEVADAVQSDPTLVGSRDPQGVSALLWSVYFSQPLIRDFLLARLAADGIALDIFEAAALGDLSQLQALLAAGPELVHANSGDGWTPLHLAAAFSTPEAVSLLLAAGARVDALSRNPQQNHPLHAALALGKNVDSIRLLLDHGAPVNAAQAGGFTPIFSAAAANRGDLAEILLSQGADPAQKSDSGKSAADFARERGHSELAAWLDEQSKKQ
ncbi:MAG TPA: ankyrin repeat domain-containing protein [Terracidiphilus sp.]|nr:ankyrin repeat domain-containing protein [Terracidiphilus sp.]